MTVSDNERIVGLSEDLAADLLGYFARRVEPSADAADLLSETFVVLCRRAGDLPASDQEARLWAFGVARRVLSGHRRSRRRKTALVEKLRRELGRSSPATREREAGFERVQEALSILDETDREIVRLIHWEGFAQAEVSVLLGIPAGTVRSRYSRARVRLRQQLQGVQTQLSRDR